MKKLKIGNKEILVFLLVLIVLICLVELLLKDFIGVFAYYLLIILISGTFYIFFRNSLKNIEERTFDLVDKRYKQIERLNSLYLSLEIKKPLPFTGGWAAFPDLLEEIKKNALEKKPKLVVEASSGVSSIILGYCMKKNGFGKVISLEHDIEYVGKTKDLIEQHGLQDFVSIVHAPLVEHDINSTKYQWYCLDALKTIDSIDLVVVDGPPFYIQSKSRYPVIPLLYDKMANGSSLILDDGNRKDEKTIVDLWVKEFKGLNFEYIDLEAGAFLVQKKED